MSINLVKLGRERDLAIETLIAESGPYNREQIQQLFFPDHVGPQKCSERLRKLYKAKKIKRIKLDTNQYIYYVGDWKTKEQHKLMVNWAYVALKTQKHKFWRMIRFKREWYFSWDGGKKKGWADALVLLESIQTKQISPVLIEVDRGTSNNKFEKVDIYTEYFKSKAWWDLKFIKPDSKKQYHFPRILVITDRPKLVSKIIDKDNKVIVKGQELKLRFRVATIEQIKDDFFAALQGGS